MISPNAEDYVNDELVERNWVMRTIEHSEIYFSLICSVADPSKLRLTENDYDIYQKFRIVFPKMAIDVIKEDDLKSKEGKEIWRPFCMQFEYLEDYNFACLLRSDCKLDYSEENSILVPRIQFLALEIARNYEGLNNGIGLKYKNEKNKMETAS